MKKIALTAMMFLTTSAYGYMFEGGKSCTLEGKGVWKTEAGDKGNYRVSIEASKIADGTLSIVETFQVGDKEKQINFELVKKENGFFDVQKDDQKVGEGYCFFKHAKVAKTCHVKTFGEHQSESTMHINFAKRKAYRMGSFVYDGKTYAWSDHLKKSKPQQERQAQEQAQEQEQTQEQAH